MSNDQTSKRPTHYLFAVIRHGETASWTRIGAAWTNSDGKGFNLKLELLPLAGADLVMREPKEGAEAR